MLDVLVNNLVQTLTTVNKSLYNKGVNVVVELRYTQVEIHNPPVDSNIVGGFSRTW